MLMGFKPDGIFKEEHLIGKNVDEVEGVNMTWPYPPVLILEAQNDWDHYKERIQRTLQFLREQVTLPSQPSPSQP